MARSGNYTGSGKYTKQAKSFWGDADVRAMSDIEKLAALYMMNRQANRIGLFAFSVGEMAEDLDWSVPEAKAAVEAVCARLGWHYDAVNRVLYLPGWWKRNAPENDSHFKGCLGDLGDVPTTPLLAHFLGNHRYLTDTQRQELVAAARRHPDVTPTSDPPPGTRPPTRVPPRVPESEPQVGGHIPDNLDVAQTELTRSSDVAQTTSRGRASGAPDHAPSGADADPVAVYSPELGEAVMLCTGHPYLAEMLDPAVTLAELRSAYPDLSLVGTIRQARAALTPERIEQQRRRSGPASRFLTSFFAIAERERVQALQAPNQQRPAQHAADRTMDAIREAFGSKP